MRTNVNAVQILDYEPTINDFRRDVLDGLRRKPKQLDSKLLYDEKGSTLFEDITTLPEYYPTRTEIEILKRYAKDISSCIGGAVALIELGSGSSKKTKNLLNAISDPTVYMPVDISKEFLHKSAQSLVDDFPNLQVTAICADYTKPFHLPNINTKRVVFFPGSTFGNFEPLEGEEFLRRLSRDLTREDGLLIGIDLKKSTVILNRAYNDSAGITAAFNLNVLERINRELNTDFQLNRFVHYAFFNEEQERIEMHLKSLVDQVVMIGTEQIEFKKGETIHTENSYKFTIPSFQKLVQRAGFQPIKVWADPEFFFSVHYLQVE